MNWIRGFEKHVPIFEVLLGFQAFLGEYLIKIYQLQQACPTWNLGGLVQPLVKVLAVEIWSWNLAHMLRRSNQALGIFFWFRIFSGGFTMGLKRNLVKRGFWATGKRWEAEILQGASLIHFRTSKFYSAWLVNWLSFKFNFPGTSLEFTNFLDSPNNDIL